MEMYIDKRDSEGNITNLDEVIQIMLQVATNSISEKIAYFEDVRAHAHRSEDKAEMDKAIAQLEIAKLENE